MTSELSPSEQVIASSRTEVDVEVRLILAERNPRQSKHQQEFSLEKKAKYWKNQELAYNCQKLTGKRDISTSIIEQR
jgi:hypothetical protein